MVANVGFWDQRARKFGHTGYGDRVVYAFDQLARRRAIGQLLERLPFELGTALDFGCGAGDFAKLLAGRYQQVLAFDISAVVLARARTRFGAVANIRFLHGAAVTELNVPEASLDLILSVTTLGHVMDDEDLTQTLAFFRRKMKNTGLLIALECTPSTPQPAAAYQCFRTFLEWQTHFAHAGLPVAEQHGYNSPAQPALTPYTSYSAYIRHPLVRLARRIRPRRLSLAVCSRVAAWALRDELDFIQPGRSDRPMTVMVARPAG